MNIEQQVVSLELAQQLKKVGYNVITIIYPEETKEDLRGLVKCPEELEPMTNLEAYYFIKGFKFLRD